MTPQRTIAAPTDAPSTEETLSLFRCAVCKGDQDAWAAIYRLYRGQMVAWAIRWSYHYEDGAEALADRGFARFWRAMTPERFQGFISLAAIMAYLKLCIRSEAIDAARWSEPPCSPLLSETAITVDMDTEIDRGAFWKAIRSCVSDEEWIVIHEQYMRGCKPSIISQLYPSLFPTPRSVYAISHRVLPRLSRQEAIQQLKVSQG